MEYCKILGTNINVTNMEETVHELTEHLEQLRGNYICVSNVHTTVMAYRDAEYQRIQNSGAMALPDGKPLSIESRRRGYEEAGRVPGPDLMPRIFQISREKGYRHYFYGSTQETLDLLKEKLLQEYPELQIAGMYAPPFRPLTEEEDARITEQINESQPDYIWVALGAPKQEKWMFDHQDRLKGVMLGVGAAFSFSAGTVKRAPAWMQEMCLEWLYRILQDPIRLIPRYVNTNLSFLWNVRKENKQQKKDFKDKRIAMIGHKRIPSREGGVEIVVEELSKRLVKQGYLVEAYNRSGYHVSGRQFDEKRGKYYQGIRIHTIPTFRNTKLNAIVYSILATLRALFGRYQIIHFHAEGPCIMIWLPKLFGIKVVATIHGLDWQRSKWGNFASKMLKTGEKMAAKRADAVIVLSSNVQNYFRETYGRETLFISNGIERPRLVEADLICKEYGIEKNGYYLFLARLVPEKGVHYLIEAYEAMDTDRKLIIAGGRSGDDAYMEMLFRHAEKNKNIIMTNFVQGQLLEELFSNAFAFVLPSDVEGMAISLLEAMSYGNCCIVSDISENTEVVEDKAITFRHGDVADLQHKMEELEEDPELAEKYRIQAADFICAKYNWDMVTNQTIQVYEAVKNKE